MYNVEVEYWLLNRVDSSPSLFGKAVGVLHHVTNWYCLMLQHFQKETWTVLASREFTWRHIITRRRSQYLRESNTTRKGGLITCRFRLSPCGDLLISPSLNPTLHFPAVKYSIEYCHQRRQASAVGQVSEKMTWLVSAMAYRSSAGASPIARSKVSFEVELLTPSNFFLL